MKKINLMLAAIAFILSLAGRAEAALWACFRNEKDVVEWKQIMGAPGEPTMVEGSPCRDGGAWHLLRDVEPHASETTVRGIASLLRVGVEMPKVNTSGMTLRPWTSGPYKDWSALSKPEREALKAKWGALQEECRKVYQKGTHNSTYFDAELIHAAKKVFTPPQGSSPEDQARYLAWHVALFKGLMKAETGLDGPQDTCEVSGPGAGGLIQVVPSTIDEHCDGMNVLIPSIGLECGLKEAAHYAATKPALGGNAALIFAAYNMGYGGLLKNGMKPYSKDAGNKSDTLGYIRRILRFQAWYLEHGLDSEPPSK